MPRKNREEKQLKLIGRRIARARRDRGYTQNQFSEKLGSDPTTISRLENGRRLPSLFALMQVADALGISLGKLLDTTAEVPEPKRQPEELEMARLFSTLNRARQELLLKMARELCK